jgi:HSP20 family protein
MRYRKLSYRYALVLTPSQPRQLGIGEMMERAGMRLAQTCWRPPADVYETPFRLIVTTEIAGIDPENLDVLLFDDALVIDGQRRITPAEDGHYQAAEIPQGHFRLEIPLPTTVDAEKVDATYEQGLLQITLHKAYQEVG